MTWKPIYTAPLDMQEVLLWDKTVGVVQAYWDGKVWVNSWDSEEIPGQDDLLFWHPIPLPPGEQTCRLS